MAMLCLIILVQGVRFKPTSRPSVRASLIIFVPLASKTPNGLERVVDCFGAHEVDSPLSGVLPDHSISGLGSGYLSTLVAGAIGVLLVLLFGLLLTKSLKPKTVKTKLSAIGVSEVEN
jgi:hypothetical protein